MSTDFDFDIDDTKKENRIHAASESSIDFDFDNDFLNDSFEKEHVKETIPKEEQQPLNEPHEEKESFQFDLSKEDSTDLSEKKEEKKESSFDFSFDNLDEKELEGNHVNDFSLDGKDDNVTEHSFDDDFSFEPVQEKEIEPEPVIRNIKEEKPVLKEDKKVIQNVFDDMDEEPISITKNNDKKVDNSSKNDKVNNIENDHKKGLYMSKREKQEEVFDDEEFEDEQDELEEVPEKPKPIFLQKWFIPAVGGVLFVAFIGVKMANGGLGAPSPAAYQPQMNLTMQNQPMPPIMDDSKPEQNALTQNVEPEQPPAEYQQPNFNQQVNQTPDTIQQEPVSKQTIAMSNTDMVRMAAEQKQLLDQQMQETNLKINNQNVRLDRIETNIGQISNNMMLIANGLTDLKNSFNSAKNTQPLPSKDSIQKANNKQTLPVVAKRESTEKHFNHYHNKVNVVHAYPQRKAAEPLYGNVKMAINGSAWVVNNRGETIELKLGDNNAQYGRILSIDENNLTVKTSKGILHSNY